MAKKGAVEIAEQDKALLRGLKEMSMGVNHADEKKPAKDKDPAERNGATYNKSGHYDVSMKLIEEDPHQPRQEGLTEEEIASLAKTIERHGMIQPISLRKHPDDPEKYMINVGARRFRAYKLLKRKTIPATFAEKFDKRKQMVENLQRKDMTNAEVIAGLLEMAEGGMKGEEIAEELGKDTTWVSQHLQVSKAKNADIREAFLSGKIKSVAVAYELAVMAKKNKDADAPISEMIASGAEITSTTVKALKNRLANPQRSGEDAAEAEPSGPVIPYTAATTGQNNRNHDEEDKDEGAENGNTRKPRTEKNEDDEPIPTADPDEPKAPRTQKGKIFVMLNNEEITILDRMPTTAHRIWIKTQDGREKEVQRSTFPFEIRVAQE